MRNRFLDFRILKKCNSKASLMMTKRKILLKIEENKIEEELQ
jgi:hypothetical protein